MGVDLAYFVAGQDVNADRATGERRLLGALWQGLPAEFSAGVDAAVDLGSLQLYVFRGDSYVRIPFGTQAVDDGYPQPIGGGNWPGLSFDRVDAAMNWGDGKVYFFRGQTRLRGPGLVPRHTRPRPSHSPRTAGSCGTTAATRRRSTTPATRTRSPRRSPTRSTPPTHTTTRSWPTECATSKPAPTESSIGY